MFLSFFLLHSFLFLYSYRIASYTRGEYAPKKIYLFPLQQKESQQAHESKQEEIRFSDKKEDKTNNKESALSPGDGEGRHSERERERRKRKEKGGLPFYKWGFCLFLCGVVGFGGHVRERAL